MICLINRKEDLDLAAQLWLQVNRIAHEFIDPSYWEKHFYEVRQAFEEATLYGVFSKNDLVGFIGLQEEYIAGIFVKTEFQKRGLGQQLLNKAKQQKNLKLYVYAKNENALNFYLNRGFTVEYEQLDETGEIELQLTWHR